MKHFCAHPSSQPGPFCTPQTSMSGEKESHGGFITRCCKYRKTAVFEPFIDHPNNRWSKPLDRVVPRSTPTISCGRICMLKERYRSR
jgi:hypothetical protein